VTKVEITTVDKDRRRSAKRRKRRYSRVVSPDGQIETRYTLELTSDAFASDVALVFQSAVNKARRENKKILGTPDVEPK
jgi:hypothetical protein